MMFPFPSLPLRALRSPWERINRVGIEREFFRLSRWERIEVRAVCCQLINE